MKLSFVIPAYNEERVIARCLESIIKETKENPVKTEIIVVNNASTDKTGKIAAGFPEVKVVNEPKKGLTNARRAGYEAAKGELIANIDADNIMPKGWLSIVLSEFEKDPKLVALSGPFVYFDLALWRRFLSRSWYTGMYIGNFLNQYLFHNGAMLQGGNYVITRKAMDKIGGFSHKYDFFGEDADVARRARKAGKVKFTFKLPILSSGRRLKDEGMVKTAAKYLGNYIWTIFFKKPLNKKSEDIRD